jgi:transposase
LPRVDDIIDLSEDEKEGMKLIGEEVSEQLVILPSQVYVKRTIRKKYAPIDNKGSIKIAPAPKVLLPKTMASSNLIAYIIASKYVDALPLYRLENIFERVSAMLTRQTMARWLITVSNKLIPLYNLLQDICLERDYWQMDETTVQVLVEAGKKATSKSYMWVRHAPGDNPIILYDYAPSRNGAVPIELLEGFSGALQVDGYDGYAPACKKYHLKRLGCMDHCRRKFYKASKTSGGKNIGKKGVNLIDKLYKIEEQIKDLSMEERTRIRLEKAVPILEKIKIFIDELRPKITPKSVAGEAINYAYNEWEYLIKYIENPKYNISNIWIENAIRPFALGRRNWLFSASVDGAKASAMFFSLIETAKKNGFEPFDYLSKMLEKLPLAETVEDFEKLLPLKDKFQD